MAHACCNLRIASLKRITAYLLLPKFDSCEEHLLVTPSIKEDGG
jgi:hypothetical protein